MIICWDNLEKLEYRFDRDQWQEVEKWKGHFYIYKDFCQTCGKPFLTQKGNKGEFCCKSCKKFSKEIKQKMSKAKIGKNHPFYGKKHSEKTRQKQSIANEGENHPNWKGGITKKNLPLYDTYAPQISFCEKVRRNEKDSNILEVKCAYCGKWFIPTITEITHRNQALEGKSFGESRLYCSTECKQECPIYKKSKYPKSFKLATSREVQPELRQMRFEIDNWTCQKCGKNQDKLKTGLHCHHLEGIRHNPVESADLDMVITLCKTCHKKIHKLPGCGYNDMKCNKEKK